MIENIMKSPCNRCPFRKDVKPFLRAGRAEELAYATTNPYNSFTCHKTLENVDGELVTTENSKECAGFLSMQINEGKICPSDFIPSDVVYNDIYEMIDTYSKTNV